VENLTTQPRVPTLESRNIQEFKSGKGGRCTRGCGGREGPQCTYRKRMSHTQENRYPLHDAFEKAANFSKSEVTEPKFSNEEYKEYLRLKSNSLA